MKIAVSSLGDPFSYKTWSGIPVQICNSLLQYGHQVEPIELKYGKEPWFYNWKRRFNWWFYKKWFLSSVQKKMLYTIGKQLDEKVKEIKPDIVIVIHGDFLAYTTFETPACLIHDTTFHSILNYYSAFTNLTTCSEIAGHQMYSKALNRADAAIFSSAWASNSAINFYGKKASKVHTIPFGANLHFIPADDDVKIWIKNRRDSKKLQFLFLGIDWDRKGGPDALLFIKELNNLGVLSTITVIGCNPDIPKDMMNYVNVIGFLDKSQSEDNAILNKILMESVALLLPSHAECYGCVYCEAYAYGLPVIARNTGGVSEIVKEGLNGFLIDNDSPGNIALKWKNLWINNNAYEEMAQNARKEFKDRLNYDSFTKKLNNVLKELIIEKESLI